MKTKTAEKDAEIAALKKENAKLRHAEVWKLVEQNERQAQTIKQLLAETSDSKQQLTAPAQSAHPGTSDNNIDDHDDAPATSKAKATVDKEVDCLREQNDQLTADVARLQMELAGTAESCASLDKQYEAVQEMLAAETQAKVDTMKELESTRRKLEKTQDSNDHTQKCLNLAHEYILELQSGSSKAQSPDPTQVHLKSVRDYIHKLQQDYGSSHTSGKQANDKFRTRISVAGHRLDSLTRRITIAVTASDDLMQEVLRLENMLENLKAGVLPSGPSMGHHHDLLLPGTSAKGIPVPKTAEEQLHFEVLIYQNNPTDAMVNHRFISDTVTHIEGDADEERHRALSPRRQIQLAQAFKRYSDSGKFADRALPVPIPSVPVVGTDTVISRQGNTPARDRWFHDAIHADSMSKSISGSTDSSLEDFMREVEATDLAFAALKEISTSNPAEAAQKDPMEDVKVRDFAAPRADSAYASEKAMTVKTQTTSAPRINPGNLKLITTSSTPAKSLTREEIQIKVKQRTEAARRMALIAREDREVERRRKLRVQNLAKHQQSLKRKREALAELTEEEMVRRDGKSEYLLEVESRYAEQAAKKQKQTHAGTGAPELGELLLQPEPRRGILQTQEELQVYEDK
jgi:hypothetical protein